MEWETGPIALVILLVVGFVLVRAITLAVEAGGVYAYIAGYAVFGIFFVLPIAYILAGFIG